MEITKEKIIEAILVLIIGLITGYLIYVDFTKERKPSACEIDPNSEDCNIELMNEEYDHDYQPGAYGPE